MIDQYVISPNDITTLSEKNRWWESQIHRVNGVLTEKKGRILIKIFEVNGYSPC